MAGRNGDGGVAKVVDSVARSDAVYEVVLAGRAGVSHPDCELKRLAAAVETFDAEEVGYVGGHPVGPPTVIVYVL